jgi:hypothetical protein
MLEQRGTVSQLANKYAEMSRDIIPVSKGDQADQKCTYGKTTCQKICLKLRNKNFDGNSMPFPLQANEKSCVNDTAYCWMSCLPLPSGCSAEESECYNQGSISQNSISAQKLIKFQPQIFG